MIRFGNDDVTRANVVKRDRGFSGYSSAPLIKTRSYWYFDSITHDVLRKAYVSVRKHHSLLLVLVINLS